MSSITARQVCYVHAKTLWSWLLRICFKKKKCLYIWDFEASSCITPPEQRTTHRKIGSVVKHVGTPRHLDIRKVCWDTHTRPTCARDEVTSCLQSRGSPVSKFGPWETAKIGANCIRLCLLQVSAMISSSLSVGVQPCRGRPIQAL